jgi:hypothetical protein
MSFKLLEIAEITVCAIIYFAILTPIRMMRQKRKGEPVTLFHI